MNFDAFTARREPPRPLLKTRAAAQRLGVSMSTIRNLISRGELEAVRVNVDDQSKRFHWRVRQSSIEKFQARRT